MITSTQKLEKARAELVSSPAVKELISRGFITLEEAYQIHFEILTLLSKFDHTTLRATNPSPEEKGNFKAFLTMYSEHTELISMEVMLCLSRSSEFNPFLRSRDESKHQSTNEQKYQAPINNSQNNVSPPPPVSQLEIVAHLANIINRQNNVSNQAIRLNAIKMLCIDYGQKGLLRVFQKVELQLFILYLADPFKNQLYQLIARTMNVKGIKEGFYGTHNVRRFCLKIQDRDSFLLWSRISELINTDKLTEQEVADFTEEQFKRFDRLNKPEMIRLVNRNLALKILSLTDNQFEIIAKPRITEVIPDLFSIDEILMLNEKAIVFLEKWPPLDSVCGKNDFLKKQAFKGLLKHYAAGQITQTMLLDHCVEIMSGVIPQLPNVRDIVLPGCQPREDKKSDKDPVPAIAAQGSPSSDNSNKCRIM